MNALRQYKASVFQALSHPTRLQILEALKGGELSVSAILTRVGLEQGNVSQHLATLRSRGLVVNRKEGNQVFYAVRDPLLFEVLEIVRRYSSAHLHEHVTLLRELEAEEPGT